MSGEVLEYTGGDPDSARLKRACEYWGVEEMARKGKGRKVR